MRLLAALFGERSSLLAVRLLARLAGGLLGIALVFFALQQALPADPAAALAGPTADSREIAQMRSDMKLDRPLPLRFARYLKHLAEGDLGTSTRTGQPVAAELRAALPVSLVVLAVAGIGGLAAGLLLALLAAGRPALRALLLALAVAGAMPVYGLTVIVMALDWYVVGPRPVGGIAGLLAPGVALAVPTALVAARAMWFELSLVMQRTYIRAARAAGASRLGAAWAHGARNALYLPLASTGVQFGTLLASLTVAERLFAKQGLGSYVLDALAARDLPACLGAAMLLSVLYLLADLAVAVARALADPRLRRA